MFNLYPTRFNLNKQFKFYIAMILLYSLLNFGYSINEKRAIEKEIRAHLVVQGRVNHFLNIFNLLNYKLSIRLLNIQFM